MTKSITREEARERLAEAHHGICKHDWVLPEGVTEEENQEAEWPLEVCSKCGMSLIRHIFTEAP